MSLDLFAAMFAFSFAMAATPGPNTLMLLASGVNHGWRATVPHQFGIIVGIATLLAAVGAGLGALLTASPNLMLGLKIASAAYMIWLAWRIANSGPPSADAAAQSRPLTLLEAASFQWINPKAWAMALTGVSAYTRPERYGLTLGALIAVMLTISFPVTSAWTMMGVGLRRLLARPSFVRVFNWTMAALLIASLWPLFRDISGAF